MSDRKQRACRRLTLMSQVTSWIAASLGVPPEDLISSAMSVLLMTRGKFVFQPAPLISVVK